MTAIITAISNTARVLDHRSEGFKKMTGETTNNNGNKASQLW